MAYYQIKIKELDRRTLKVDSISIVDGKISIDFAASKSKTLCPVCSSMMIENLILFMSNRLFKVLEKFMSKETTSCYYCRNCNTNFIDIPNPDSK